MISELSLRFFSALTFITIFPKAVKTGHRKVVSMTVPQLFQLKCKISKVLV